MKMVWRNREIWRENIEDMRPRFSAIKDPIFGITNEGL